MKTVIWQSRVLSLYDSFHKGKLNNDVNGGNIYDFNAALALKENFQVIMDPETVMRKNESTLLYWKRLLRHNPRAEVIIKEPYPLIFGKKNAYGKTVAVIHHIDDILQKKSLKHELYYRYLKRKLSTVDLVVTVSSYWKDYLQNLGCKQVKVIYNPFKINHYNRDENKILNFKKKNSLLNKSIIYIGNAHRQKGVYEVYDALKDSGYELIMTGKKNFAPDLPVKFLNLDHGDYITLLQASDVVISMSKMVEGWSRTSHEALLCKTPVIGSGVGGMRELLENSGQVVLEDINLLKEKVIDVIANNKKLGTVGYAYAKKFDFDYFKNEWICLIQKLIQF